MWFIAGCVIGMLSVFIFVALVSKRHECRCRYYISDEDRLLILDREQFDALNATPVFDGAEATALKIDCRGLRGTK